MDRIRILLADDHPAALEVFARMLSADFEVVGTAEDGEAAVRSALSLVPEVVVLDIEMPGLDGFAVARRSRKSAIETLARLNTIPFANAAL